ncbi:MAG: hypothetical protein U0990_01015, partial [Candidatus Nanopelagicales bacterium]|nr:hypothetical protein [Candidatus Nanopelagicales bacterium]
MLHTTLRIAKANDACKESYVAVKQALGKGWGLDDPIPLTRILELRGLDDALWCLVAVLPEEETARDKLAHLLACDYAERVLGLFETAYPDDKRPRQAIETA